MIALTMNASVWLSFPATIFRCSILAKEEAGIGSLYSIPMNLKVATVFLIGMTRGKWKKAVWTPFFQSLFMLGMMTSRWTIKGENIQKRVR